MQQVFRDWEIYLEVYLKVRVKVSLMMVPLLLGIVNQAQEPKPLAGQHLEAYSP